MIYLVDASVYIFRAYYSELPEMTDRDGYVAPKPADVAVPTAEHSA